jgi:hypothetical protein
MRVTGWWDSAMPSGLDGGLIRLLRNGRTANSRISRATMASTPSSAKRIRSFLSKAVHQAGLAQALVLGLREADIDHRDLVAARGVETDRGLHQLLQLGHLGGLTGV